MKKGLKAIIFKLEPRQIEALRAEATRRMVQREAGRIDTSEVLREVVDAWMKRRPR